MDLSVWFPGKKKVDVMVGSYIIRTDQAPAHGGDGSAPEPFDLFLASIGACAGVYVLAFCESRGIPTDGIRIEESAEFNRGTLSGVALDIIVPPTFPAKYVQALQVAAGSCAVKRAFEAHPQIKLRTVQTSSEVRA